MSCAWHNQAALNRSLAAVNPGGVLLVPAETFHIMGGVEGVGLRDATIHLDGTLKTGPRGFNVSWAVNTSRTTVLLYQRLYQNRPHYVKNVAYEAGVHIDFILRHYDNLPHPHCV